MTEVSHTHTQTHRHTHTHTERHTHRHTRCCRCSPVPCSLPAEPTVTAAHRTAAVQGGLAVYHFSHSAATLLPVTESLKWCASASDVDLPYVCTCVCVCVYVFVCACVFVCAGAGTSKRSALSYRCGCRGGRGITDHAPVLRTRCWAAATSPSAVCHRRSTARAVSSEWWTSNPSLHGPLPVPTALH